MPSTHRLLHFLAIFLIQPLAWAASTPADASDPIVNLGYATYAGSFNRSTGHTQFLGMRYAAPPTGNLRWRAPQAPTPVSGIQPAHLEPSTCFFTGQGEQAKTPFRMMGLNKRDPFAPSEDCLFLNVYTPVDVFNIKKKLPVVVFIHGGGYASGSASGFNGMDAYDGNDLILEANQGIVAVVIQYRLGVFGFLPGSEVKRNGVLNAGLLDQHFALRWVHDHITEFGGDPTRVTIWGQSAGAGSVIQHVIAQDGKTDPPLFRAAITSSSFLPSQYKYNDPIPEQIYHEVITNANGSLNAPISCSSTSNSLDCLRQVDVNTLETVNNLVGSNGFFGTFVFVPVVDGTFITQRPIKSLEEKKVNGKALLSVTNTFEGALFVDPTILSTVEVPDYISQLFPTIGQREIQTAATHYAGVGSAASQAIGIMGEAIFICPTYYLLRAFEGKSFKGEFAIPPGGHGNDVPYYFTSTKQGQAGVTFFNDTDFINGFSHSFLDFAMTLDPSKKSVPTITPLWHAWDEGVEMLFNKTASGSPDVRPVTTSRELLQRCEFWESVGGITNQ